MDTNTTIPAALIAATATTGDQIILPNGNTVYFRGTNDAGSIRVWDGERNVYRYLA